MIRGRALLFIPTAILIGLLTGIAAEAQQTEAQQAQTGRAAIVQSDATLKFGTELIRLAHIRVPPTGRSCDNTVQPPRCGSRAFLALAARVQGLVQCKYTARTALGGPRPAFCSVSCTTSPGACREDLGGFLIAAGWAVPEPGARAEYLLLEVKARQRLNGNWSR